MWLCIFIVENRVITGFNAIYTRTIDLLTELLVGVLNLIPYGHLWTLPSSCVFHLLLGFQRKPSLAKAATVMTMDARKSKKRLVYEQKKNSENIYGRLLSCH